MIGLLGLFLLSMVPPVHAEGGRVTVFAAASMKNALDEIAGLFQSDTGNRVIVSYAGSSAHARQIQQGAPADVFISANPDWMDLLERDGLVDQNSRTDLLGNSLVLVAPASGGEPMDIGPEFDISQRLGDGRLAMALVDAVPAGIYGKAALTSLGLWTDVASRVAQTDNVRAALAFVAAGEAPLGIVYGTDAHAEKDVHVVGLFPASSHPPIVYPVARIAASENPVALELLDYLRGPAAGEAFRRQGFSVLGAAAQ